MAEEANIPTDFYIGTDVQFPFVIYQKTAAGVLTSIRQNITGWAWRWDMRRYDSEADPPALTRSTASGTIVITDANNGEGYISIADTDTDGLPARAYRHAMKRTDDGSEGIAFYGNAILARVTTR